ncbi:RNA polymerase sigma factor [Phenylobacterium sp.]|uniref:RNA polymerase sigma factor n=1 Tax=Phenylobacterium sp. TaxID=1871053 RepID=UPI00273163F2|nr:sigma-70 family RNA polymerase sigma factor [Phenylobacterium sp.]MDP1598840.1 sigma-70 family RNA polymerase sigma factor [Phenylobacterium sp.]MDP3592009.1 sigma-70 family RNA polymerase sigma factor [Phenylobacterium sp.]
MSRLKNNGPDDQLTQLYRRHAAWLRRMVRKRFVAEEDAEDIVQETYLRISRLADENIVVHPKALLLRVARNAAIDRRRRVGRGPLAAQLDAESERQLSIPSDQAEDLAFKQIVMAMPLAYRDVFLLSRISGLTYEEIALEIGLSVKTVEWRMSKALRHCQRMLQQK